MPKILYISTSGSDANPGTYKSPKKSPQGLNSFGLVSGDTVLFRQGDTFTPTTPTGPANTFVLVKTNGVTFDSYTTGLDSGIAPVFSHTGEKSVVFGLLGNDNRFRHMTIQDGETCVTNYQDHSGNTFESLTIQRFGDGLVDKGSNTTIKDCHFAHGRMIRDLGDAADYGARAIVLERYKGTAHTNTQILTCLIEDCYAPSKAFGYDGAAVELFGGVDTVLIEGCTVRWVKIMSEMGAVTTAKETIRNVVYRRNVITGLLLYTNPTSNAYYGDLEGVRFERNTVFNDTASKSPVFIGAGLGDLNKKLSFSNNLFTSSVQMFNAGAGSNLETISRSGNVYSGADVGMTLVNGETQQDIPFVDAKNGDYRLAHEMLMADGTSYIPGASGRV